MSARAVHTARGGNPHTHPEPKTQKPDKNAGQQYPSILPVSCSYSIQSYISTRRSVDEILHQSIPKQHPCSRQDFDQGNVYELRRMNNKQASHLFMHIDPESSKSPRFQAFLQYMSRTLKRKTFQKQLAPISPPKNCLLYTSPSPRDLSTSRMPSSA